MFVKDAACVCTVSLILSYNRVYNHLRHTTEMVNRDLIYCYVGAQLPFGSSAVFSVLCNSVDTSSIIMTFLTADGWGKMV